jgi:serine/threonine protein kinase
MLVRNGYGKSVDWWALGALCFEMLTGAPPFRAKSQKDLDKKILHEKFASPPFLSANAHALLKGMLDKDVNKRLGSSKSNMFSIGGVAALKQHAFFQGLSWDLLLKMQIPPPIDIECPPEGPAANFHEGFTSRQVR